MAKSLSRYSIPPEQYAALRASRGSERVAIGAVDEIRFEGLERTNPEVLGPLVKSKPGEPLTEEKIGADMRRIYGRGDFESVDYQITGEGGPRAMVIKPHEKLWGPDYLRFGLGLQSDFQGDNAFNLLVQYRKTWINQLGGEWLTEAQVGQDTHLFTEFYQPLHKSSVWFGSVYGQVGQTTRGVFSGDDKIAEYLVGSARAGVDLEALLGTVGRVRFGALWNQTHARVDTGDPVLSSVRELSAGGRLLLTIDQLDHAWFPQKGYRMNVSLYGATQSLGSEQNYQRIEGLGNVAKSWGRPHVESRRLGRHGLRFQYAGIRDVLAWRATAIVGFPAESVHGPRVRIRPPDVLQPLAPVAGYPGLRAVHRRFRRDREDPGATSADSPYRTRCIRVPCSSAATRSWAPCTSASA